MYINEIKIKFIRITTHIRGSISCHSIINVVKSIGLFKGLISFTPVYRDICRTCEALGL